MTEALIFWYTITKLSHKNNRSNKKRTFENVYKNDESNLNFLRLTRKGGNISNVFLDLDTELANQVNEDNDSLNNSAKKEMHKYVKLFHGNQNLKALQPFPVYVSNLNGFVERHMIQPHLLPSEDNTCGHNNEPEWKVIQGKNVSVKVSISFE